MKQRFDRIGFARAAIDNFVPWLLERGTRHDEPGMPEYLELVLSGLRVLYVPSVRNLPWLVRPRELLDIYPEGGRKVFSVEWQPMRIIAFRPGPWIEQAQSLWAHRLLQ